MSAKIKLHRLGRKKREFFRIVVADEATAVGGKVVANLGYYDPLTKPPKIEINKEELKKWLSHGVQPTDAVRKLLKI
ncbi:MAG: 30S ribosomal protein S16, small subunit ribosomal protein S16 [Candidatus Gottesmanbacteria bacterium GW2011_GWA2_43_14]|uniref:Small ribosomal subunit protein bS16 n=1 Tax=Candidatus Gottesmanbacteria bacterium GW2011_GWA2_43_14 TaxID=1618443 RepID=A0A0G1FTP2_9BACT|nr:MAG: 30S ribosomal protein S16, small subunit ribosomal protein S16 [Candidatus Gottesmanbacteria bacterium GW2011_GWA2_43_14]